MTLADLFIRLPWYSPAWRLNLLSAVMASSSAGMLAWTVWRYSNSAGITLTTALCLAFAPLLWSQALITEVYTTAAFFSTLVCVLIWQDKSRVPGFVVGLVWGLGIATHTTLIFLSPLVLYWIGKDERLKPSLQIGEWLMPLLQAGGSVFLGLLLGALSYSLLFLRGAWPQPWGNIVSLQSWWEIVSARLYWGFAFGLPLSHWPARLLAWAALLARQFTPVGALCVILGLHSLRARSAALAWSMVAALALGSIYAVGYNTPDSLVYLVSFLPLLALWLAEGLMWLGERGVPHWIGLGLSVALLALNWGALDLHNDTAALSWIMRTLEQAADGAVLVTHEDHHTFALWYAQEGLDLRPDVVVVDRDLWANAAYRNFLSSSTGQLVEFIGQRPFCEVGAEEVVCQ